MKRSEINQLMVWAEDCFRRNGWALPPDPRWDVTDFGLGDWREHGLVLVNLADEPEYCEKLMYARHRMKTPCHTHVKKKEDIICRSGALAVVLTSGGRPNVPLKYKVDGELGQAIGETRLVLQAGSRVTLVPGVYHEFWPLSEECVIGEVSTANDDANDNVFTDSRVGRYPEIEEDEAPIRRLIGERSP